MGTDLWDTSVPCNVVRVRDPAPHTPPATLFGTVFVAYMLTFEYASAAPDDGSADVESGPTILIQPMLGDGDPAQHGFITIPIHMLFQDEGFEITPPEYAIQVGNAGRPVATSARRSQSKNKAKAKAKAQAFPDDLKIRLVLEEDGEVPAPPPGWGGAVPK